MGADRQWPPFWAARRELASNQLQANPLISNLSGCTSMTIRLTPWPSSSSNTSTGSAFEESSPPMTSRELQWYVSGSLCGSHPSEGDRDIANLKPRVRHQVDAAFNRSHTGNILALPRVPKDFSTSLSGYETVAQNTTSSSNQKSIPRPGMGNWKNMTVASR